MKKCIAPTVALAFALAAFNTSAVIPTILLVSDNAYSGDRAGSGDPEADFQSWLEGLGYNVIRATGEGATAQFRENNEGSAGAAAVPADLIIVSRVTNSGSYDEGNHGAGWNAIEKPLLLLSPYLSRASRWQWLNGGDTIDQSYVTDLNIVLPDHPFVQGLGTSLYDPPGASLSRNDFTDAGNGTVIATAPDGDLAIVEWEAGVPFYEGGQTPAGKRVLFAGLRYHEQDNSVSPPRYFTFEDYSENGKALLAQTIATIIPEPGTVGLLALGSLALMALARRHRA